MKKFLTLKNNLTLVGIGWLSLLLLVAFFVSRTAIVPAFPYYQSDLSNYTQWLRVFAHFDGIHYLRIASYGYRDIGTQAFFPLYPLLIRYLSPIFPAPLYAGIFLSLISVVVAVVGLSKLFPQLIRKYLFFLLLFPTSFFLVCVYTESLFLALVIWFFVFLKQKKWLLAAIVAGLASATRPTGAFLALSLGIELLKAKKPQLLPLVLVALSGLLSYMYFLSLNFHDPLMFFHVQPLFGAERTGSNLILLPQVLYRYSKMVITVDTSTFLYQRLWFELLGFVGALYLCYRNLKRIPLSQSLFVMLSLLLPTLTGTLSSMPRYLLVLLPWLLPASLRISRITFIWLIISAVLMIYSFTIFSQGTFVS